MSGRDVYIAIMVAAAQGKGVHLTADEAADLSMDDAIATRALNGLADGEDVDWASINPRKSREPANAFCDMHASWGKS